MALIGSSLLLISSPISVTIMGNLLDFGQLFQACGNNYFAKITHILGNFLKIFHFSSGIISGQLLLTFGDFLLITLSLIVIQLDPIVSGFELLIE